MHASDRIRLPVTGEYSTQGGSGIEGWLRKKSHDELSRQCRVRVSKSQSWTSLCLWQREQERGGSLAGLRSARNGLVEMVALQGQQNHSRIGGKDVMSSKPVGKRCKSVMGEAASSCAALKGGSMKGLRGAAAN